MTEHSPLSGGEDGPTGAVPAPEAFAPPWDLGRRVLQPTTRPLVMGIVNLTPDSFYPASRQTDPGAAIARALAMVADGADLLDLGAESTRPGAEPVSVALEQDRLLPVVEALSRETDVPVTVDTYRPETARLALAAGADAINDISGGRDPQMLALAAANGCGLILMHMRGEPRSMQEAPRYDDVVAEVTAWLGERATAAENAGVAAPRVMVDPGIGFGKLLPHNLALLAALKTVAGGRPLLLGASRKRFIAAITDAGVDDRLGGSLAALSAAGSGGVTVVRVHDVAASVQYLDVLAAINAAAVEDDRTV